MGADHYCGVLEQHGESPLCFLQLVRRVDECLALGAASSSSSSAAGVLS